MNSSGAPSMVFGTTTAVSKSSPLGSRNLHSQRHRNRCRSTRHCRAVGWRKSAHELIDTHGLAGFEATIRRDADENRVCAGALVGHALVLVGGRVAEDFTQHDVVAAAMTTGAAPWFDIARLASQRNDARAHAVVLDAR